MSIFKEVFKWIIILTAVLAFQSISGIESLNITLIPVYWLGLRKGAVAGMAGGIYTGLLEDALTDRILGPGILSKGLAGIISSYFADGFFLWRPAVGVVFIFLLSVFEQTTVYLSLSIFATQPTTFENFLIYSLVASLINTPAGALISTGQTSRGGQP